MKFNNAIRLMMLVLTCAVILVLATFIFFKIKTSKFACDKCNVVLISIDTLSALHLPCYGYERNTAPNLCSFADKNIFFLNSYSQSPNTLRSHFSIFTSLYPYTHKMLKILGDSLSESYLTLAQLYKMNGYKTFYYGPLDDLQIPLNRGIERGFDFMNEKYSKNNEENWDSVYQKLIENTEQKKPSFFFLHTYAVHDAYLTGHKEKHLFTDLPEYSNIPLTWDEHNALSQQFISFCTNLVIKNNDSYFEQIKTINNYSNEQNIELKQITDPQEEISAFNSLTPKIKSYCFKIWNQNKVRRDDPNQIEYLKALYDEQIHRMDQGLGKFLDLIADPKLSKNTIVVITADHGEEFMEHGSLYHGANTYRTSVQVPLIIHVPGVKPKKITELVQGIDIYPTIINLTGIYPESPLEGIDLSGLIKGEKNAKTNNYIRSEWNAIVAVQSKNLRYYYYGSSKIPIGLYDLTTDPQEQNNLQFSNLEAVNQFREMLQ